MLLYLYYTFMRLNSHHSCMPCVLVFSVTRSPSIDSQSETLYPSFLTHAKRWSQPQKKMKLSKGWLIGFARQTGWLQAIAPCLLGGPIPLFFFSTSDVGLDKAKIYSEREREGEREGKKVDTQKRRRNSIWHPRRFRIKNGSARNSSSPSFSMMAQETNWLRSLWVQLQSLHSTFLGREIHLLWSPFRGKKNCRHRDTRKMGGLPGLHVLVYPAYPSSV